jgi:hypothetical protein
MPVIEPHLDTACREPESQLIDRRHLRWRGIRGVVRVVNLARYRVAKPIEQPQLGAISGESELALTGERSGSFVAEFLCKFRGLQRRL